VSGLAGRSAPPARQAALTRATGPVNVSICTA
jgi:hypothetical protein